MIDRETAIEWATECGIWVDSHGQSVVASIDGMERFITRGVNEAFEQAAKKAEGFVGCEAIAEQIRALKVAVQ